MGRIGIKKDKSESSSIIDNIAATMDDSQVRLIGSGKFDYIEVKNIQPDSEQVRKLGIPVDVLHGMNIDQLNKSQKESLAKLDELANNIDENGLINPITVYKNGAHYTVLAGERRYWAHVRKGLVQIQAIIRSKPKDEHVKIALQLSENLFRSDLSFPETVNAIRNFAKAYTQAIGTIPNNKVFADTFGFGRTQSFGMAATAKLSTRAMQLIDPLIRNGKLNNQKTLWAYAALKSDKEREDFIKGLLGTKNKKSPPSGLTLKIKNVDKAKKLLRDLKNTGIKAYDFDEKLLDSSKGMKAILEQIINGSNS
jgi:ParB/RepB/Spo0J family partition protein